MKTLLLLPLCAFLSSCAGSGEGGTWTPQDTTATVNAANAVYGTGVRAYQDYQNGYRTPPTYVTPVVPTYPAAPLTY